MRALTQIRSHLRSGESRATKARRIADLIRKTGNYRWVGIYVVENKEIAAIAWTGPNSPAYPRFPIHQGLNGEAVRTSRTMNVGDVSKDPRYLPTLGTTRSEIIVPVLSAASRQVIGTIDVESERFNAFASRDVKFLEECAGVLSPLYD